MDSVSRDSHDDRSCRIGPSNTSNATTTPTPAITSLKPTSGPVATAVTITGTNFGASQVSNSSVSLNGTVAPVISWTNTSIVADMPSSAITGNVVVTAAGVPSAGTAFTVTAGAASTCGSGALGGESVLNGTYTYVMQGFQGGSPQATTSPGSEASVPAVLDQLQVVKKTLMFRRVASTTRL